MADVYTTKQNLGSMFIKSFYSVLFYFPRWFSGAISSPLHSVAVDLEQITDDLMRIGMRVW